MKFHKKETLIWLFLVHKLLDFLGSRTPPSFKENSGGGCLGVAPDPPPFRIPFRIDDFVQHYACPWSVNVVCNIDCTLFGDDCQFPQPLCPPPPLSPP